MKKELEKYFVIADTVQEMNGDIWEVMWHMLQMEQLPDRKQERSQITS